MGDTNVGKFSSRGPWYVSEITADVTRHTPAARFLLLSAADALGQVGGEVADRGDRVGRGAGLGETAHEGRADDHAVREPGDLSGLGAGGDSEPDGGRQAGVLADARDDTGRAGAHRVPGAGDAH